MRSSWWLFVALAVANLQALVDEVSVKYSRRPSHIASEDPSDSIFVRGLKRLAARVQPVNSIADAVTRFETKGVCEIPTPRGTLKMLGVTYRLANGDEKDAVAVYGADRRQGDGVLVRVHDQCLTSEVFHSLRCDCRQQLNTSLARLMDEGGVLIYLLQEGRNIGLANKIAAYQAQQELGFDTVDANLHLGLPEDARSYRVVPLILESLGVRSIRLLTNNPRKVEHLRAAGVVVADRVPMSSTLLPENERYLRAKVDRMAHDSSLLGAVDSIQNRISSGCLKAGCAEAGRGETLKKIMSGDLPIPHNHWRTDENDKPTVAEALATSLKGRWIKGPQSVESALKSLAAGRMVIVVDDEDRENEGDFIMAAELASPSDMGFIIKHSGGVVCVPMPPEYANRLNLPPMTLHNQDAKATAFTVSVDANDGSTGISGEARSRTARLLARPGASSTDFTRPGHVFPLVARRGGTLVRQGHTEASVDLMRLAGLQPVAVISEIFSEDDESQVARLPELERMARKWSMELITIQDIACFRLLAEYDYECQV